MRRVGRGSGWLGVVFCLAAAESQGETVSFSVGDDGRVRIEVPSSTDRYHVLYYRPAPDEAATEYAVAIHRGEAGSVVLSEPLRAESGGAYRVATHSASAAGDVDGDGIDDLTELDRSLAGARAPLNHAAAVAIRDGAVAIPDMATFQRLSYQGPVRVDQELAGLEHLKFFVTRGSAVYFMNTNSWDMHFLFWKNVIGLANAELDMFGVLTYFPNVVGPGGRWEPSSTSISLGAATSPSRVWRGSTS